MGTRLGPIMFENMKSSFASRLGIYFPRIVYLPDCHRREPLHSPARSPKANSFIHSARTRARRTVRRIKTPSGIPFSIYATAERASSVCINKFARVIVFSASAAHNESIIRHGTALAEILLIFSRLLRSPALARNEPIYFSASLAFGAISAALVERLLAGRWKCYIRISCMRKGHWGLRFLSHSPAEATSYSRYT